jgi:hypothetical protein
MKTESKTILIGGVSRLPKELSQGESLQAIVELDPGTGIVLEVSFSPCLPIIEKLITESIVGKNLEEEGEAVLESIRLRLHHRSQKAYLAAIRDLMREYNEFKYGSPKGPQAVSISETE